MVVFNTFYILYSDHKPFVKISSLFSLILSIILPLAPVLLLCMHFVICVKNWHC